MTTAATILNQLADDARYIVRTTHIDLDVFLACDATERARRWCADYSAADRHNLVALMLERKYGDWDADAVATWLAYYDAKYGRQG